MLFDAKLLDAGVLHAPVPRVQCSGTNRSDEGGLQLPEQHPETHALTPRHVESRSRYGQSGQQYRQDQDPPHAAKGHKASAEDLHTYQHRRERGRQAADDLGHHKSHRVSLPHQTV